MNTEVSRISPALGAALRSGAKTTDQILIELMDQFVEDAKAIDPTILGAWVGRDLTLPGRQRDPGGAVQSVFFERAHAPLRSSGKVGA